MPLDPDRWLRRVVGGVAVVAPVLHSATDAMEWVQGGFSPLHLWLNYIAFLPMPWLLLGVVVLKRATMGVAALTGAILYGIAFTYFAHTTMLAIETATPDYAALWGRLGATYTVHGALMIVGGLLFAFDAWRTRALPRTALVLFVIGLLVNLAVALLPVPEIAQTLGTLLRNAGLVGIGIALLRRAPASASRRA